MSGQIIHDIERIGQAKDTHALPVLRLHLRHSDPLIRYAAAIALGQIGDKRALSDLTNLARADPNESVRRAASAAIDNLVERSATSAAPVGHATRQTHRRRWGAAFVALIAALAVVGWQVWNRPLGPELLVPTSHSALTPAAGSSSVAALTPQCGGPPVIALLLAGLDSGPDGYETGFTDVIRVARIDFVHPSAILLAIPRDLWVTIPGLSPYGISENRIKTAYPYGNHYQLPGGGISLLAQTLQVNFGLTLDHYAVVDFQTFAQGIDAIGGIDLDLPAAVGEPADGASYFAAGQHHLDGKGALSYVRSRPENTSDLLRIDRQTQVIMAVRDKVFGPQWATKLPALIPSFQAATRTDLSPAQISSLICIGERIPRAKITLVTMSGNLYISAIDQYGYERLLPNLDAVRQFVQAFQRGDAGALKAVSPGG